MTLRNPDFSGFQNTPGSVYVLGQSSVPLVHASPGTITAGGALTLTVALPSAYPDAYMLFPANAFSASPAGWYYVIMSNTTQGNVYTTTYVSGTPTIPTSPVLVTGSGAQYSPTAAERSGYQLTIPGSTIGIHDWLTVIATYTNNNSAGTKNFRIRYGGSGTSGTVIGSASNTTNVNSPLFSGFKNNGKSNQQSTFPVVGGAMAPNGTALNRAQVDTTVSQTLAVTTQVATSSDTNILEGCVILLNKFSG